MSDRESVDEAFETLHALLTKAVEETSTDEVLRALAYTLARRQPPAKDGRRDGAEAVRPSRAGVPGPTAEASRNDIRPEGAERFAMGEIIGQSAVIRNLARQVELVAPTDASTLVLGESGTGKELVAREIHRRSSRSGRRLVKVNCVSVPRDLYESEFFGHVRGAFTGALKDRAGRFELADGGTLFLDEVGEIPFPLQGKLLRVLQEGEFERVGEEVTRRVDVRIVSATNRDLKAELEAGRFRRDLFYRLAVFPIEVAPLRQRKEDIPLLAEYFLERAAAELNRSGPRLTHANIIRLQQYDWPGNIRELRNVIERAVITSRGDVLHFDLPHHTAHPAEAGGSNSPLSGRGPVLPDAEVVRLRRENTLAALEEARWKIYGPGGAAELLGLPPTTLLSRIKRLGIEKPRRPGQPR